MDFLTKIISHSTAKLQGQYRARGGRNARISSRRLPEHLDKGIPGAFYVREVLKHCYHQPSVTSTERHLDFPSESATRGLLSPPGVPGPNYLADLLAGGQSRPLLPPIPSVSQPDTPVYI